MARPEKKERNSEIYQKHLSGVSYGDLSKFYNIDRAAIWRIVKRLGAVDKTIDETLKKE